MTATEEKTGGWMLLLPNKKAVAGMTDWVAIHDGPTFGREMSSWRRDVRKYPTLQIRHVTVAEMHSIDWASREEIDAIFRPRDSSQENGPGRAAVRLDTGGKDGDN